MTKFLLTAVFLSFGMVVSAAFNPAQAEVYFHQSQSATQSFNGGEGKQEFKQSQTMSTYSREEWHYSHNHTTNDNQDTGWKRGWHRTNLRGANQQLTSNDKGEVRVSWSQRGGTCTIRYSEGWGRARTYQHETSTGCDDGALTLSSLKANTRYRVLVTKN